MKLFFVLLVSSMLAQTLLTHFASASPIMGKPDEEKAGEGISLISNNGPPIKEHFRPDSAVAAPDEQNNQQQGVIIPTPKKDKRSVIVELGFGTVPSYTTGYTSGYYQQPYSNYGGYNNYGGWGSGGGYNYNRGYNNDYDNDHGHHHHHRHRHHSSHHSHY